MKKAMIIGGNSGIGLSVATELLPNCSSITILGKNDIDYSCLNKKTQIEFKKKITFYKINLIEKDYSIFKKINDIDILIITAGFGRVAPFESLCEKEIQNLLIVNQESIIEIIKIYYEKIKSDKPFYTAIMGSIAGHIISPLFSVYGAAKAGLCMFIKNINIELISEGCKNRILDVSPGALSGTSFNGKENNLEILQSFSQELLHRMYKREILWVPEYKEKYKRIINDSFSHPIDFGMNSYQYKKSNNRIDLKPQLCIGYLSGTFDLFHIGHLNIIKKAKDNCDLLIVGIHKDASHKGKDTFIPFEERKEIVASCKYVDKVVEAGEDNDDEIVIKYNCKKLFVGSDYKGSERFKRYEKRFENTDVKIVYFPYTKTTSSSQIRDVILKTKE